MPTRNGAGDDGFETVLIARRKGLVKEHEVLIAEISTRERRRSELEEQISHIDALLGKCAVMEPASAAEAGDSGSGNETADLVVDLLREVGRPLHYREIEQELRARGAIQAEGKNPANTLLARYFNDPRLYRPARGTYDLRNGRSVRSVGTKRNRSRRGN